VRAIYWAWPFAEKINPLPWAYQVPIKGVKFGDDLDDDTAFGGVLVWGLLEAKSGRVLMAAVPMMISAITRKIQPT